MRVKFYILMVLPGLSLPIYQLDQMGFVPQYGVLHLIITGLVVGE